MSQTIACPNCKKTQTNIRGYKNTTKGRNIRLQCLNPKCDTNYFSVPETRTPARILCFDIETAPMEVYAFDNHPDFIPHTMLKRDWFVICWSAIWYNEGKVVSAVLTPDEAKRGDDRRIVELAWHLLDSADIVVAHNGKAFDQKKMNDKFIFYHLNPTTQYRVVDTKEVFKRVSKSSWNGQDFLSKKFGREGKIKTDFTWWIECMRGNPVYLKKMVEYCNGDILDLQENYTIIRSWDNQHPNLGVYADSDKNICPVCGSDDLEQDSKSYKTQTNSYPSFRCSNCGHVSRGRKTSKKSSVKLVG